jgi:hypothetical protein
MHAMGPIKVDQKRAFSVFKKKIFGSKLSVLETWEKFVFETG